MVQDMTLSETFNQLHLAGLRHPGILTLAITGVCNLDCRHCWVRAGEASSLPDVPLSSVRRIVEDFAEIGGEGIRITGGEPLCHPHWLDIVRLSNSLGFKSVILQTNAVLFKDKPLAELRELDSPGVSIQISLDGASAQTHDFVRGEGAYNETLQGIARLVQAGLGAKISIFFTEMRHNLEDIPDLLDLADRIGLGAVSTGAMVQCGRASEAAQLAPPGVEQYLRLLARYDNDAPFRQLYHKIGSVAALEWRTGDASCEECCTFVENPYLTPSGRLYPCLLCHADEFSVTGVFVKGLAAALVEGVPLWSTILDISRRRREEIPQCQDCPGIRCCAGGCMGRAWGSFNNLLAADDRCVVRKAIYQLSANSCH